MKDFFKKNTVPFIIGVITSLVGTYIYSYFQPERIIVSYEITQPLDIGKGLSTIFPSFELRHNENIINDGVVQYIHGRFINTSKKDVKTTPTNRQIELILNDSCQVMDVNVPKKNDYDVEAIKSNNRIIFLLPETLKPKEEVEFSAIINNHDEINPIFELKTRIQDVSLEEIKEKEDIRKLDKNSIVLLFIIICLVIYLLIRLYIEYKHLRDLQERMIKKLIRFHDSLPENEDELKQTDSKTNRQ